MQIDYVKCADAKTALFELIELCLNKPKRIEITINNWGEPEPEYCVWIEGKLKPVLKFPVSVVKAIKQ